MTPEENKVIQDEGKRLCKLLTKLPSDGPATESTLAALDKLDNELREAYASEGKYIRNPSASRLTCRRGVYYNEQSALTIRAHLEPLPKDNIIGTKLSIPGVGSKNAVQFFRQGFNFLYENLDPTGQWVEWHARYRFSKDEDEVLIVGRDKVDIIVNNQQPTNWRAKMSEWSMTDPEQNPEVKLTFRSLSEWFECEKQMNRTGLVLKNHNNMTVTIGYSV